jgi:2-dehydro-3-deoxyglucarate aldolase/4-hydroxy-2-oxoheptanedioate aldolase
MASGLGNTDFQGVSTQEYINFSNEETLVIVQIETPEAVAQVEALAAVPGIDVFFIGPDDLSIALGWPGQSAHPQMQEIISQIVATAIRHQIFPGIPSGPAEAIPGLRDQGFRLLTYGSDVEFIYNGARQGVQALRG